MMLDYIIKLVFENAVVFVFLKKLNYFFY
jgi:hypothetical protein